jgi:endonuclease YncB( thermonuclease family)
MRKLRVPHVYGNPPLGGESCSARVAKSHPLDKRAQKEEAMRLPSIHSALLAMLSATVLLPPAHAGSSDTIWSSGPVRVDKAQQSLERLPAKPTSNDAEPRPDRYPLRLKRTLPFRVTDSVSFVHDGRKYRLVDLEAVPVGKICRKDGGQRWACGLKSRLALSGLLRGKQIVCAPSGEKDGAMLVECARSSKDIGSLLAEAGYALTAGAHYQAEQETAQREKAGVWSDSAAGD